MGGEPTVTMFNMNKFVTFHLLEKLDKSAYDYEKDQADGGEEDLMEDGEDTLM
jgi:hypothetical protein